MRIVSDIIEYYGCKPHAAGTTRLDMWVSHHGGGCGFQALQLAFTLADGRELRARRTRGG